AAPRVRSALSPGQDLPFGRPIAFEFICEITRGTYVKPLSNFRKNFLAATTGRRIPTSQHASGSGACRGLYHRVTPSVSSPPTARSHSIYTHDATDFLPWPTGKRCSNDSTLGRNSPPSPPPHKG